MFAFIICRRTLTSFSCIIFRQNVLLQAIATLCMGAVQSLAVMAKHMRLTRTYANYWLTHGTCLCDKQNMLSWLSKLCVWWCIINRLKEYIPPIYTRDNGFESIAELLNVLSFFHGNLRVVATKEIPPSTEVVMDYHIQRSCFHASGTCATRESPAFQCFLQYFLFLMLECFLCAPFWYVLQEKPYSRELCVKCSSCFRGIHKDCLTPDDLHVLYEEGVLCSVCTANKKKRT